MCGILCIAAGVALQGEQGVAEHPDGSHPCEDDFAAGLQRRGPHFQGRCQVHVDPAALTFAGSLLQLRGAAPAHSPHVAPRCGSVLLYNGEIFGGLPVPAGCNDGAALLEALTAPAANVPAVLASLRGPWALVFWHAPSFTLWFGRDVIGRRSLLLHLPRPSDGRLLLASCGPLDPALPFERFIEVPPGLQSIRFQRPDPIDGGEPQGRLVGELRRHEWADPWLQWLGRFTRAPSLAEPPPDQPWYQRYGEAECGGSSSRRGGSPARARAEGTGASRAAPPNGALGAAAGAAAPAGAAVNGPRGQAAMAELAREAEDPQLAAAVDRVLAALRASLEVRCRCIEEHSPGGRHLTEGQPPCSAATEAAEASRSLYDAAAAAAASPPAAAAPAQQRTQHPPLEQQWGLLAPAPVLILFSGGVDSTLMAALAHEALPPGVPIDLASICFSRGASPDRLGALDALEELRGFAPERDWRLIQVDCTLADVDALRPRLLRLLAPRDQVMDLNIGAALWLAAQAEGTVSLPPHAAGLVGSSGGRGSCAGGQGQPAQQQHQQQQGRLMGYKSQARVVLLGHGADELCGGYGRHRTKFREGGWAALNAEMALDMGRLWQRNLGRDDRLVADHGREARHPFLDERVVAAVLEAPLPAVVDLRAPPGAGDKRLLRACLRRLGLRRAAARVKRAIQFGTGLGQQSNKRDFGSNRAANLRSAGLLRLAEVPEGAQRYSGRAS